MSQNSFPQRVLTTASYQEPGFIVEQAQTSGYPKLFDKGLDSKLSPYDLAVYFKSISRRSSAQASQNEYGMLPSASIVAAQYSIPAYKLWTRSIVGVDEAAVASQTWGYGLMEGRRTLGHEAIYQAARTAAIFGVNPANGEGILNSPNIITGNLPPDSLGNDTFVTYDSNDLFQLLLNTVTNLIIGTFQGGLRPTIVILGPQRIINAMVTAKIVKLTSFQRQGSGSASAGVSAKLQGDQADFAGYNLDYQVDDTLMNSGPSGSDIVIFTIPSMDVPGAKFNTNEFGANSQPQMKSINKMYIDAPLPREIQVPISGGATELTQISNISSGVCLRGQATNVLYVPYE
jgi:hypothetical protein